jgi:hypothetical protein
MDKRPQELVEELRRAIAHTPDPADQKTLYEKLGLLEVELAELARHQRAVREADAELTRARHEVLGWRLAIAVLVVILIGMGLWLAAGLWQAL